MTPFDFENGFYLSCKPSRLARLLAHYELFKMVADLPGAIVECGVFKGASFCRFAMLADLFTRGRKLIGFDTFAEFPETEYAADMAERALFIGEAGSQSIGKTELDAALTSKGLARDSYELVAGDIRETVPAYAAAHPELRIALLNLDVDIYEPSVTALEHLWPRIVHGGVIALDDYGVFAGETAAADKWLAGRKIERFPWSGVPSFVRKQ